MTFDFDDEVLQKEYLLNIQTRRGLLIEVQIADIHFGAINPRLQYEILEEQFLNELLKMPVLDIVSINGDLYDHQTTASSDTSMYANIFINRLVQICKMKNATIILIEGTSSHDAKQTKLFSAFLTDPEIDFRIVQQIKFEYIKGARILCIPELYRLDESIYQNALHYSGIYDSCFMHGTFIGSVYGDNVGNGRLFTMADFDKCRGPIFAGHIHKPGCFQKHFYYSGTPIRYKHGEEEAKGFIYAVHDLDSGLYQTQFHEIFSFKYRTIEFNSLISEDPKDIINYILKVKNEEGIDNIRIIFNTPISATSKNIMNNYFKTMNDVVLKYESTVQEIERKVKENDELNEFSFILDDKYSDEEKFVLYCNTMKGEEFLTVDMLTKILSGTDF